MYRKYWIEDLPGMPPLPRYPGAHHDDPAAINCCLIEKGYVVEYLSIPSLSKNIITLFFGPGDILVRCHPTFSLIQALTDVSVADFPRRDIFRTLRNFPDAACLYRKSKFLYEEKAQRRISLAKEPSDKKRLDILRASQPWALSHVPEDIIANYLGITAERLRELKGQN